MTKLGKHFSVKYFMQNKQTLIILFFSIKFFYQNKFFTYIFKINHMKSLSRKQTSLGVRALSQG